MSFGREPWRLGAAGALTIVLAMAPPARAGWMPSPGIEEGVSLGNVGDSRPMDIDVRGHWSFGGSASLVAEWAPAAAWSLEFAPGWEHAPRKVTIDSYSSDEVVREFDRVQLPVRIVRRLGRSSWSLEGAAGGAWLARARTRIKAVFPFLLASPISVARGRGMTPQANIFEGSPVPTTTFDDTDSYHRLDGFVSGGIGWERALGGPRLRVRARWQQGLSRMNKYGNVDIRLSGLSATAGLLW